MAEIDEQARQHVIDHLQELINGLDDGQIEKFYFNVELVTKTGQDENGFLIHEPVDRIYMIRVPANFN